MSLLNAYIAINCLATMICILGFNRQGRRFKRSISILAYLLLNLSCLTLHYAISQGFNHPVPAIIAAIFYSGIAALLLLSKGNVAYLLPRI